MKMLHIFFIIWDPVPLKILRNIKRSGVWLGKQILAVFTARIVVFTHRGILSHESTTDKHLLTCGYILQLFFKIKLWNERPVVVLFARELSYL